MSSADFNSIRVLLRLKRHEQPPPRYFNEFSSIVIARIEAGERGHRSWWERFTFDLRPFLAGTIGATACGLVLFGLATADQPATNSGSSFANIATPTLAIGATLRQQPSRSFAGWQETFGETSITPVIARSSTWPVQRLDIVPASFSPH